MNQNTQCGSNPYVQQNHTNNCVQQPIYVVENYNTRTQTAPNSCCCPNDNIRENFPRSPRRMPRSPRRVPKSPKRVRNLGQPRPWNAPQIDMGSCSVM